MQISFGKQSIQQDMLQKQFCVLHPRFFSSTITELALIDIKLNSIKRKFKQTKYIKNEWQKRLWWKQRLIRFDKPNWWFKVTGWEKTGLFTVLQKKGFTFFNYKYQSQSVLIKLYYGTVSITSHKLCYLLAVYPLTVKKQWFSLQTQGRGESLTAQKFYNKFLVAKNSFALSHSKWNKQILYQEFKLSLKKVKGFKLTQQLFSKQQNNAYLAYDTSIKNKQSTFKLSVLTLLFLKNLKQNALRDNSYYITLIDFRLALLTQPYHQSAASLLTTFYAYQLSLLASRKTQRWFIRDCKKFNFFFYRISLQKEVQLLEISQLTGINFNVKGRITDTRRVFSKQHRFSKQPFALSKLTTKPLTIPTYSQTSFTSKWGSTNIRVVYYSNPFYFPTLPKQPLNQRQRSLQIPEICYQYNKQNTGQLFILETFILHQLYVFLTQITQQRTHIIGFKRPSRLTRKFNLYTQKTLRNLYSNNYSQNLLSLNRSFKNKRTYLFQQTSLKTLFKLSNYWPRLKSISPFIPQQTNLATKKWLKYIVKQLYKNKKKLPQQINNPKLKYRQKKALLRFFKQKKWFLSNVYYTSLGKQISNLQKGVFNYK